MASYKTQNENVEEVARSFACQRGRGCLQYATNHDSLYQQPAELHFLLFHDVYGVLLG
jgi:hypothetical protein